MAVQKLERDDVASDREVRVLSRQIEHLREQLQVADGDKRDTIRNLIEARTARLKEIQ